MEYEEAINVLEEDAHACEELREKFESTNKYYIRELNAYYLAIEALKKAQMLQNATYYKVTKGDEHGSYILKTIEFEDIQETDFLNIMSIILDKESDMHNEQERGR